jgi:xylose dehydrogenase (NAD/NADP)
MAKILKWGLLSTARINRRLIPAIRAARGHKLVAVASRDFECARKYARQWGIPTAYGTYEEKASTSFARNLSRSHHKKLMK